MDNIVWWVSNHTTIRILTLLFFLSFAGFAQRNNNCFIATGIRPMPFTYDNVVPSHIQMGYYIAKYNEQLDFSVFGVAESNFKHFNNIGLGLRTNFFKKRLSKTFYFFFEISIARFNKKPTLYPSKNIGFMNIGPGFRLNRNSNIEVGIGSDSHYDLFDEVTQFKVSFVYDFEINLKRDKRFKQNPKKQLKCPKVVCL